MLTYDSLGAKRYLSEKYGMKVTCAFAELNKHNYADTDSAQIKNAERLNKVKRCLFKSCMDQYRDYVTMCDDPDRNEIALALQRARVATLYNVIESCGLELEYAAFKEIMHE